MYLITEMGENLNKIRPAGHFNLTSYNQSPFFKVTEDKTTGKESLKYFRNTSLLHTVEIYQHRKSHPRLSDQNLLSFAIL